MPKAWLTYSWLDDVDNDVTFIEQQLRENGLEIKRDRWNLQSGYRLWEQIADFIMNPEKSDALIIVATLNSLTSEACMEEYYYALQRTLENRGGNFPIIAIFPHPIQTEEIPAGLRVRLYINLTDPDWMERTIAAVEQRELNINKPNVQPYFMKIHEVTDEDRFNYGIEVRPRVGIWVPFMACIPIEEKGAVGLWLRRGVKGSLPKNQVLKLGNLGGARSKNKKWWVYDAFDEATPDFSYFLMCKELPSFVHFGVRNGEPIYELSLK